MLDELSDIFLKFNFKDWLVTRTEGNLFYGEKLEGALLRGH